MILPIAVGTALLLIVGLIVLATNPNLNTETPAQSTPRPEHRTFPAELTDAERAAFQQIAAALEADRA